MATGASLLLALAGCSLLALAVSSPIIQPRPVNNQRDPRDGEPFEWEPVDDDPWPGPSFTFPANLPGIDDLSRYGARAPSPVQLQIALQFMRALFGGAFNNNNNNINNSFRNKPVSSNELLAQPSRQQQKLDNKRYVRNWAPLAYRR